MNECSAPNLVTITLYFYKFYYIQTILLRTIDLNVRGVKTPSLRPIAHINIAPFFYNKKLIGNYFNYYKLNVGYLRGTW